MRIEDHRTCVSESSLTQHGSLFRTWVLNPPRAGTMSQALLFSPAYSQCLVQRKSSVNLCWMNKWVSCCLMLLGFDIHFLPHMQVSYYNYRWMKFVFIIKPSKINFICKLLFPSASWQTESPLIQGWRQNKINFRNKNSFIFEKREKSFKIVIWAGIIENQDFSSFWMNSSTIL